MKKVFISHPLSENFVENKKSADKLLKHLSTAYNTILFISPIHLFLFYDYETPELRKEILEICKKLILECDELWSYGDSKGCVIEENFAKENYKIVKYFY